MKGQGVVSCVIAVIVLGLVQPVMGAVRLEPGDQGVCREVENGRMWQVETSRKIRSLAEAETYVAELNLGGHSDWRLPSVGELFELTMMVDLHETGNCSIKVKGNFWSGDKDMEGRVGAWELDDNCDPERQYVPKQYGVVRAVRN